MVRYSIVIPAHNALSTLPEVLAPLSSLSSEWEVIVVDDCSQDDTLAYLHAHHPEVRILPMPRQGGQAVARNAGAAIACGEFLVFIDSDVVAQTETLFAMTRFLQQRPELVGVFGCYSEWGYHGESPLSRFRNLQHRRVHQRHRGLTHSFWTGLSAMRSESFLRSGGFDAALTGIEDVEFGKRIVDQGGQIWLEPSFEGRHLKRWTLGSMVKTDILVRALPWTFFGLLGRTPRKGLNLSPSESLPVLLLLMALLVSPISLPCAGGLWGGYLLTNLQRYRYFGRSAGFGLGLRSVAYLTLHHACCLLGAALGALKFVYHQFPKKAGRVGHLPESHQTHESHSARDRDSLHSLA